MGTKTYGIKSSYLSVSLSRTCAGGMHVGRPQNSCQYDCSKALRYGDRWVCLLGGRYWNSEHSFVPRRCNAALNIEQALRKGRY